MNNFSSLDNQNYFNSLNEYASNLNSVNSNFENAKEKAQQKVEKFNQAIRDPLNLVSVPLTELGIASTIDKVKANFNNHLGEKTEQAINKTKQIASDAITKGRQALDDFFPSQNPINQSGDTSTKFFKNNIAETNLDEAIKNNTKPPPIPDEFNQDLIPSGAGGRVNLTEPKINLSDSVDVDDELKKSVTGSVDNAFETATETAKSAGDDALKVGGDVLKGLEGADVSEGFLNPIADIATAGAGIALSLTGLFSGKHIHTPEPPKPLQFVFQAGSN